MTVIEASIDGVFADFASSATGLIYDYSPVPFSAAPDRFVLPEVIEARGRGELLVEDWCGKALYRADPVQNRAARITRPFYWSYHAGEASEIDCDLIREEVAEITERLLSWQIGRGVTVPIHLPDGGFATLTAFLAATDGAGLLAEFSLAAYRVQDRLDSSLPHMRDRCCLSPRETECLSLTAEGLSSKQIAFELQRSESMVVKHLQSAASKLGARNRSHAVALAVRQGWLG
ncbi:LuxR C-terminal-related transcriptional regulator [Mesorhizobium sp. Z1-4]|uniref:helix-turn-helix transcriptional regulator n=1 Tax=Mesorhizobium sp. Z1-4 TaxID=2448478 RepID=UPI000FDCB7C0|nr:LuxR C-terminal-related transcriptional regulator [Mesorhizobium sp. Z1-4]